MELEHSKWEQQPCLHYVIGTMPNVHSSSLGSTQKGPSGFKNLNAHFAHKLFAKAAQSRTKKALPYI